MLAAFYGHADTVQLLLDHGAKALNKSRSGATALNLAARGGHYAVVEILKGQGTE